MTFKRPTPTALAHLLLIAVALIWGATFPLVKSALRGISPLLFNFVRMSLASLLLLALNWRGLRGLARSQWPLGALAGLCLALGYELQTTGLRYTSPSKSALLTGLVVVLVPLLGNVPGLRVPGTPPPHLLALLGAISAFVGIALLTSEPGTGWLLLSGLHRGEWLTLSCAFAFTLHLLTLAHAADQVPVRVLGTLQIAFAALGMLVLLPLDRHPTFRPTPVVIGALGITSVLATAVAFTIQSWAQQYLPPSHTALILTLEPVFALLTSYLVLGEHLRGRALDGAALILLGIILAELGPTALSRTGIIPLEP